MTLRYAAFVVALVVAHGERANAGNVAVPATRPLVVSAGDSITYGFGLPLPALQ